MSEEEIDPDYNTTVEKILKQAGFLDLDVNRKTTICIEFSNGYLDIEYREKPGYGSMNYGGAYHPDVVCVGDGICLYCGRTLYE